MPNIFWNCNKNSECKLINNLRKSSWKLYPTLSTLDIVILIKVSYYVLALKSKKGMLSSLLK